MAESNNVSILIQHDGRWDGTGQVYVDYKIEGVIYDSKINYAGLINTIASQLGVDTTIFELEIKYVVSDRGPPLKIHNDMGVLVYLDQRRVHTDFFSKFSLCVTCVGRAMEGIEYQICAQNITNSSIQKRPSQTLKASNAICLSGMDPIVDDCVGDIEGTKIIDNPQHDFVKEGQVYMDKHTLSEVMQRYALLSECRFIVVRSSPTK